ncbi:hypothetical protein GH714_039947 [Hevea brasiliensis]|uniref:PPM-type phosphatase domain-containing protein n=1 Tax=Hevea brasiliensis TaxID=3981 RepID=A0A6A6MT77_HEVBR|nr:hypothetical protein GH714_039947 [Hevea brasiliensis]
MLLAATSLIRDLALKVRLVYLDDMQYLHKECDCSRRNIFQSKAQQQNEDLLLMCSQRKMMMADVLVESGKGHGGSHAAEYLKEHLFDNLMKRPQFMENPKLAISETYQQTDVDFLDSEKDTYRDDGSTASTAVLVGNHLYVANVGDSRTVISKAGKAIPLSEDHKPNRSDERKRIESAGGVVMWAGTWRVGGVLAMSRAFGNRMLKQFVVAEPEIQDQKIDEEFELLVLASDGLWDVVPNEDAVSIAQTEEEPEAAARKLTEAAFTRGSADNITCIVVRFHHDKADKGNAQSN